MDTVSPDKVRFTDLEATTSRFPIHTVELSDNRSVRPFLTFWFKGATLANAWAIAHGVDPDNHSPDVYHRESERWLAATFPDRPTWAKHVHIDLAHPPRWEDVEPFVVSLPPVILAEVKAYLEQPG